ncbi:MAG TPA: complex I subunit 5 family protein, partial [Longimicrobiales bacterium]|nr:complex I subunit 5 family protein [Longimicrobiales bacterium]
MDPTGAVAVAFAGFVTTMALLYAWRYFDTTGPLYHALVLLLLAGLAGLGLTGDLFGFFVFLELMVVSVYALTAYKVEAAGPLLGALNLGVASSVGASFVLVGIALLYGRTGALNLAEVGRSLAGAGPDALLLVSLTTLTAGLFVKAAVVPFHFAHMDALTEGPTPVVMVLGGAVAPVILLGLLRIHRVVFDPALGSATRSVRDLLLILAALTVVVASCAALAQGEVKRLLAFTGVAHVGLGLLGLALPDPDALAGAGVYLLSHGGVLAALFALSGVLLHRRETTREAELRDRNGGRGLGLEGGLFMAGGLALAGLPPFGLHAGGTLVGEAAGTAGVSWIRLVFLLGGVLTGGAVLRVAGRAFFALGPRPG